MKAIILCAGYGTRFQDDLNKEENSHYNHLIGCPKPLLPIKGKPLISYWLEKLSICPAIKEVAIISNAMHLQRYEEWLQNLPCHLKSKPVIIVNDGSISNETRSGAVSCMALGAEGSSMDILFIAGDTLFSSDFNLNSMVEKFSDLRRSHNHLCLIASSPVEDEEVSKHGIIEVDDKEKVLNFIEKPLLSETKSRIQSPCFYIVSQESLKYIKEFLDAKADEPLVKKDASGTFIQHVVGKLPVFAYFAGERYDIGNLKCYQECEEAF